MNSLAHSLGQIERYCALEATANFLILRTLSAPDHAFAWLRLRAKLARTLATIPDGPTAERIRAVVESLPPERGLALLAGLGAAQLPTPAPVCVDRPPSAGAGE